MKIKEGVEDWQILLALAGCTVTRGDEDLNPTVPDPHDVLVMFVAEERAKEACARTHGRIDYFAGRPIKTNVRARPELDLWLYDRDAGLGAGEKALRKAGLLDE